jgi:hypothetical protein
MTKCPLPSLNCPNRDGVCVRDSIPERRDLITSVIASLGARAEVLDRLPERASAGKSVAVVGLEQGRVDDAGVAAARELGYRGFRCWPPRRAAGMVSRGCSYWRAQVILDQKNPSQ